VLEAVGVTLGVEAIVFMVALFVDVVGGTLIGAGDGACTPDTPGFTFAALLVIGFEPEQNSHAQSPLSCESPINQMR
jgi:hypothetical protein